MQAVVWVNLMLNVLVLCGMVLMLDVLLLVIVLMRAWSIGFRLDHDAQGYLRGRRQCFLTVFLLVRLAELVNVAL